MTHRVPEYVEYKELFDSSAFKDALVDEASQVVSSICSFNSEAAQTIEPSMFDALQPPDISIRDYSARLVKYGAPETVVIIAALLYLDRLVAVCPNLRVTFASVHRLMLSTMVIAIKYWQDHYYSNKYLARVGGVSTSELNKLELEALRLMDWNINITPDSFAAYAKEFFLRVRTHHGNRFFDANADMNVLVKAALSDPHLPKRRPSPQPPALSTSALSASADQYRAQPANLPFQDQSPFAQPRQQQQQQTAHSLVAMHAQSLRPSAGARAANFKRKRSDAAAAAAGSFAATGGQFGGQQMSAPAPYGNNPVAMGAGGGAAAFAVHTRAPRSGGSGGGGGGQISVGLNGGVTNLYISDSSGGGGGGGGGRMHSTTLISPTSENDKEMLDGEKSSDSSFHSSRRGSLSPTAGPVRALCRSPSRRNSSPRSSFSFGQPGGGGAGGKHESSGGGGFVWDKS